MSIGTMREAIADALEDIALQFKPGVKLSLLARDPSHPDGSRDLLMTDDEPAEIIRALQTRIAEIGTARSIDIPADREQIEERG